MPNEEIRNFTIFVSARKLKLFLSNFRAIVDYYGEILQAYVDMKAQKCLEKYATSSGKFEGIHHLWFYDVENKLILGIQYNQKGQILKTEYLNEEGNIQEVQVNPKKAIYTVKIYFGSKKSQKNN